MKEDVLEQVTIEKLAAKANEYAQARKGPIIDGKYVYSQVKPYEKGKQSVIGNRESGNLKVMNDSRKMSGEKIDTSKIECFNCHEKGHYANWCKKPLEEGMSLSGPRVGGEINGHLLNIFVDSGCTRTLVHRKFLPVSQDTDEKITIMMANGERVIVPLAKVELKSKQGT